MSDTGNHVIIVGGGVIGLCSGWYLAKAGYDVTILDRDPSRREGCSNQNAGMIVPSHFIPLAAPGVIGQGLKWMLNPSSPFYLRPRIDPKLWWWCGQFFRHCNARHVDASKELLRDLSLESRRLFFEIEEELEIDIAKRGLLMLCRTEAGLADEKEVAEMAHEIGIEAEICDADRVAELDPDIDMDVLGGIWFGQDCHLDPANFLDALQEDIKRRGGKFVDSEVIGLERRAGKIDEVICSGGTRYRPDHLIIACGAWSPALTKHIGLKLPMQGGKGYSLTLENPRQIPRICSLLKEGRVAVTPMGDRLRVAGTMEICGNDLSISRKRLQGIIESFCLFFPKFSAQDFSGIEPWSGLRPCSPDGLPYLGHHPELKNLIVATGHSMLGLSLGPVTGQLVEQLVSRRKAEIDIAKLRPDR